MKRLLPYAFLGLVLLAGIIFLSRQQQPVFDPRISLQAKAKAPYGSYAACQLLTSCFPGATIALNRREPQQWLPSFKDSTGQLVVIVNAFFNPSETELDHLTAFAQKGNTVWICALQMNEAACKFFHVKQFAFYPEPTEDPAQQQPYEVNFTPSRLTLDSLAFRPPLRYMYPGLGYDNYFTEYDSSFAYALGYGAPATPNLLAIRTIKGCLFLHSAPVAFTNYFLLYKQNHIYLQQLMKLVPGKVNKVIWDEYFQQKTVTAQNKSMGKGIFGVLLRYSNFRWAFCTALLLLLLYLLTAVKRRQRRIPEYGRPRNESLVFAATVGKLYYEKGDHLNLATKLTQLFLDQVRNRYKLSTAYVNAEFAAALAQKAGVPIEEAEAIVAYIHATQLQETIQPHQLMEYHALLEKFYQKTG